MLRIERSLTRLGQWTIEPELPPRVMFGKHFGKSWPEVPEDYLTWILRQPDFDEGPKWAASQELARREAARAEFLRQELHPETAPSDDP
jgi:hypothetical protein